MSLIDHNPQVNAAAASGVGSFAVLTDGTVWTWGTSKRGQLGLGPGEPFYLFSCSQVA